MKSRIALARRREPDQELGAAPSRFWASMPWGCKTRSRWELFCTPTAARTALSAAHAHVFHRLFERAEDLNDEISSSRCPSVWVLLCHISPSCMHCGSEATEGTTARTTVSERDR